MSKSDVKRFWAQLSSALGTLLKWRKTSISPSGGTYLKMHFSTNCCIAGAALMITLLSGASVVYPSRVSFTEVSEHELNYYLEKSRYENRGEIVFKNRDMHFNKYIVF
jgi:hypothetical protein